MPKFNLVEITKVEYGVANTTTGVAPTVLKEVSCVKSGSLNIDVPQSSPTGEYCEQKGQTYRVRASPVMKTVNMELVTEDFPNVAELTGAKYTAATSTTPANLAFAGKPSIPNKYIKITGKNTSGENFIVILPNVKVDYTWTGAMGYDQETVGLNLYAYLLADATAEGNDMYVQGGNATT